MFEAVSNKACKVFSKLYVGKKNEQGNDVKLGFATPYEDNAAGAKRRETVDNWAREHTIVDGRYTREYLPLDVSIMANTPRKGFKITDNIKKVYWGGGNVTWRVLDPNGFELEIQSNNLMALIQSVGISSGGEILAVCVWARDGAINVLLPTSTEEYKNSIKNAESVKKSLKIGRKELVIGRTYRLANGSAGQFLGKVWLNTVVESRRGDAHPVFAWAGSKIEYMNGQQTKYVVNDNPEQYDAVLNKSGEGDHKDITFYKSISAITELDETTLTAEEGCDIINQVNMLYSFPSSAATSFYHNVLIKTTVDKRPMTLVLKPLTQENFDAIISKFYKNERPYYRLKQLIRHHKQISVFGHLHGILFSNIEEIDIKRERGFITNNCVLDSSHKSFIESSVYRYSSYYSRQPINNVACDTSNQLIILQDSHFDKDLEKDFLKNQFYQLTLE